MNEPTRRSIETNGIRLNIAEQGSGPRILLCHGFPDEGIGNYLKRVELANLDSLQTELIRARERLRLK